MVVVVVVVVLVVFPWFTIIMRFHSSKRVVSVVPWSPFLVLQDYVGLLESIPRQFAEEQLLTPQSLSQADRTMGIFQVVPPSEPWKMSPAGLVSS